jgi:ABC-2 type transport system ATP-binding protein
MLKLINIHKSYGENIVLENLNLEIHEGALFGLIGPNGAGKTTLLNLILNKLEFQGEILINEIPNSKYLKEHRNKIVYVSDNPFVYDFLTGAEFVNFILDMQKIPFEMVKEKVKLLFDLFELNDFKNQIIRYYSLGMKRKLILISALVQSPKILILDEPVSGIDAKGIIIIKKLLKSLSKNGTTIIFTTHILDLIENLCDSIAILYNKNIAFCEKLSKIEKNELEKIYLNLIGREVSSSINIFEKLLKNTILI